MRELNELLGISHYIKALNDIEEDLRNFNPAIHTTYHKSPLTNKQKKRRKANKLARKQRKSK